MLTERQPQIIGDLIPRNEIVTTKQQNPISILTRQLPGNIVRYSHLTIRALQ